MNKWYEEAKRIRTYIEKSVQHLDDHDSLQVITLFPGWAAGTAYETGTRVRYGGKLWRVMQDHISQEYWTPDAVPSLFEEINETHAGTIDDPIPYSGNMALEEGMYYSEGGAVYLCTRDTVNPVYNALADLVGIYVEVAA